MAEKGPAARVAFIGVRGAGKSTLFCALTGMDYARVLASTGKTCVAAVRVVDPRLERAHELNGPQKKLVAPTLELIDTPPVSLDAATRHDNPGVFAQFRDADGFVAVLKAYDLEGDRAAGVRAQWEALRSELHLADVDVMQKRVEKLRPEAKKPLPNVEELKRELGVLERLLEAVSGGDTTAFRTLTAEDEKKLRGFQFFSRKPLIPVVNIAETDLAAPPRPEPDAVALAMKLELELMAMEAEERTSFMADYGLDRLVTPGLLVELYRRMGLQTFLTLGDKDTSAWALPRGGSAWDASGKIHTDIQKGFIHCEVVAWKDYAEIGDARKAAAAGRQRVVGRDHPLEDFDIINIKTTAR